MKVDNASEILHWRICSPLTCLARLKMRFPETIPSARISAPRIFHSIPKFEKIKNRLKWHADACRRPETLVSFQYWMVKFCDASSLNIWIRETLAPTQKRMKNHLWSGPATIYFRNGNFFKRLYQPRSHPMRGAPHSRLIQHPLQNRPSIHNQPTKSTYISQGVLYLMLLSIIWLLCRKSTPKLARKPDTIASVLLFLCGSSMLEDFKNMALMDPKARDAGVKSWDKNYAMGSVIGVDGTERASIDETLFVVTGTRWLWAHNRN